MRLLLKGGRVVDPASGRDGDFDVLVEDGRIARVGRDLPADGADLLEVGRGWIVAPGLIDIHVHLREPGLEGKETIATRARAAAAASPMMPSASRPRGPSRSSTTSRTVMVAGSRAKA